MRSLEPFKIKLTRANEQLEEMLYDDSDPYQYLQQTYIPIHYLGSGSFSNVLECLNVRTDQRVAIKVINKQKIFTTQLSMLIQEAELLKLLKHKSMLKFIEKRDCPQKFYLVMELFAGQPLTQLLDDKILSNEQIISIVRPLCEGLNYIHSQDIIHRDLKPDNILVQELEDGEFDVKIIDFGLSFQKRDTIMITQQNCGTLIYSAPEVATNHQYNQKVDIWSLGIIFYVMFNQVHPIWKDLDNRASFTQKLQHFDADVFTQPPTMNKLAWSFFVKTASRHAENRMSAGQSLEHPWITGQTTEPRTMVDLIKEIEKIKRFEQLIKAIKFCVFLRERCVPAEPIQEEFSSPPTKRKRNVLTLNFIPSTPIERELVIPPLAIQKVNQRLMQIAQATKSTPFDDSPPQRILSKRISMTNLNAKVDTFQFNSRRKTSLIKEINSLTTKSNSPIKNSRLRTVANTSEFFPGQKQTQRFPMESQYSSTPFIHDEFDLIESQFGQSSVRYEVKKSPGLKRTSIHLPQLPPKPPSYHLNQPSIDKVRYFVPQKGSPTKVYVAQI